MQKITPMEGPERQIKHVVLTGGPCAGKTTAMTKIADRVADLGYKVLLVPETATVLLGSGHKVGEGSGLLANVDFQEELLRHQLATEELYRRLATKAGAEKTLILYDRGAMDGKAYISQEGREEVLHHNKTSEVQLRNGRYDGVIHMVTAADGAEHAYTLDTNDARSEKLDEARMKDENVLAAWIGTGKLARVDNSTNFEKKIARTVDEIFSLLGHPEPLEIEDKYEVSGVDEDRLTQNSVISELEQCYIATSEEGKSLRVRKRTWDTESFYTMTEKERRTNGETVEINERIDQHVYETLKKTILPGTVPIRKSRYNFMWQNQYFELDRFDTGKKKGHWLLEIEKTSKEQEVVLPDFLDVTADVTDDLNWKNEQLARLDA